MSYEDFQEKVKAILEKAGGVTAKFFHDDGKHHALCSDGTMIVGNSQSLKVMVRWGSGHVSHAKI